MVPAPRNVPLAFWIRPERLLAGAFPGHVLPEVADRQLGALLDAGVRRVLDLMEEPPRGAPPYRPRLDELAATRGLRVEVARIGIEDHDVPDAAGREALEHWLDGVVACEGASYVHCWGGRGRTGLLTGLDLLRTGRAGSDDVASAIAALRCGLPGVSPESDEQRAWLRAYPVLRAPATAARSR